MHGQIDLTAEQGLLKLLGEKPRTLSGWFMERECRACIPRRGDDLLLDDESGMRRFQGPTYEFALGKRQIASPGSKNE